MYVDELVIEITRRCNAACRHCMRGESQNKDIDNVTIDKLFNSITEIGVLTFTGGEPSLAVDRIQYVTEQVKTRGIKVNDFYVVTNGKDASLELAQVLIDLYAYLSNKGKTALSISEDAYHESEIPDTEKAQDLYSYLPFFDPDHRTDKPQILVKEGRAIESIGKREAYLNEVIVGVDDNRKPTRWDGTVYVNAIGDVVSSCEMSYESQEQNKMGNVHDKSLSEILVSLFNKRS